MPISWCLEVHFRRERQIKCFPDLSRGEPWNFQRGVARRFAVRRTNRTSSKSGEIRVVSAVSLLLLRQWKWTGCVHQGLFKNYATSRSAMPVSSQILYWTDAKHTPKIMRVGFEKHNPLPFAFSVFFLPVYKVFFSPTSSRSVSFFWFFCKCTPWLGPGPICLT